ncbi:hypothetical protein ACLOJK_015365 [Asimina triloba]
MEMDEYHVGAGDVYTFCPRGGPIFHPTLVGSATTVSAFQDSAIEQLQMLQAELSTDSNHSFDDELSMEELKVFTDEELVEKASKEAFKDAEQVDSSSENSGEQHNKKTTARFSKNENSYIEKECRMSESSASSDIIQACQNDFSEKIAEQVANKRKKRDRASNKNRRAAELESFCTAKVEEFIRIKQKQEEDKAAAKLHSFNSKVSEDPISAVDNDDSMRFLIPAMKIKSSRSHENVPVNHPEVVLTVEIYHSTGNSKKTQEFLVLGRQTLAELRDNIYCLTDQLMQKAGQHDPSGYFLIEDVFCNDRRDPSSIDYTEPIFDWLRNRKDEALEKWENIVVSGGLQKKRKALFGDEGISQLPHFKAVDMHKVRFCDLHFRLGFGYLYCHQGDCRHIFIVRDMRLIHPEDTQNKRAYPIIKFQCKPRWQKCCICKIFRATKVTVDDKWAQENPSYFCDNCYFLLHYTEDGSLLYGEYSVYDYSFEL